MTATNEILQLTDKPLLDESIAGYIHYPYNPIVGTDLNKPGEIKIIIEQQDLFTHPSESYIMFEGELLKADGTRYADADVVTLTNNGIMHLFSQISYHLSNQEIETIYNPGQTTTMLGLLKYPDDFSRSHGHNQLWAWDTATTADLAADSGFALRQSYIIKNLTRKEVFHSVFL